MRNFNSGGLLLRKFIDRRISLVSPGKDSTGYMTAQRLVKIYYKFRKPIAIDYSAATVNRNLVLSIVSDSSAVPSPGFTSGYVYLTFKDFLSCSYTLQDMVIFFDMAKPGGLAPPGDPLLNLGPSGGLGGTSRSPLTPSRYR